MTSPANKLVVIKLNRDKQRVPAIAFLFKDQHIIVNSHDGRLQVIEANTGKLVGDPWQDKERSQICAVDVSPDRGHVATGSKDGKIQVWKWNGKTAKIIAESKKHTAAANCVCWSRHDGGAHIASGFDDGNVAVWTVASGLKNPMRTDGTRLRYIHAINYSHDGTQLIVSGYDREISRLTIDEKAQEVQVDEIIIACNNPDHVSSATWASTAFGHAIATGSPDGKIRIIELPEGRLSELEGPWHSDLVCAVVLSPAHKRVLASASYDGTLRIWDLNTKRTIGQPLLHSADLTCAAFAANGTLVAAGTCDGEIYIWDIADLLSRTMSTEDVNGRDEDADARPPFNPDSPIPTRQRKSPVQQLPPVPFDSRRIPRGRPSNFFNDVRPAVANNSPSTVSRPRRFSIPRHFKVAASRVQQAMQVPRAQLERPIELGGIQEESQQNLHAQRRRVSRTPVNDAPNQQSRGAVTVQRNALINILLRMKCVQPGQMD